MGIEAAIEVFDWATMVQFWAGLPPEKNPQEIFIMGAGASTADADWGLRPIFATAPPPTRTTTATTRTPSSTA